MEGMKICPHCGKGTLRVVPSQTKDGRGRSHLITSYNCNKCGFHGSHTTFSKKKNGSKP
jgi:predicted RNA-binding Zn-ribbon protein involved in translation (DUF1610 family)